MQVVSARLAQGTGHLHIPDPDVEHCHPWAAQKAGVNKYSHEPHRTPGSSSTSGSGIWRCPVPCANRALTTCIGDLFYAISDYIINAKNKKECAIAEGDVHSTRRVA